MSGISAELKKGGVWSNLSLQQRANFVARESMVKDGLKTPITLEAENLTSEEWGALSPQMRARIRAAKSLNEANFGQ